MLFFLRLIAFSCAPVLLLAAGAAQAGAGKAKPLPKPYDFSPVTTRIQQWVDRGYYQGASLIVVKDDLPIYERCFGNYQPNTVAYIASAGKWLAAATIASVVDEGKLSWDDPVSKWLPEFTDVKGKATLRQLLSHTSGYPDYQPEGNPPDQYQTLAESVKHIVPLPATTDPGTHFHYGGLAMQVAGRMAELATGKDWETLFQERIARPCGMTNTHFTPVDSANGHSPMLGGGARSTLRDYAAFLAMISHDGVVRGKRVLSAQAIGEMQADQVRSAKVTPGAEYLERARGQVYSGIYGLGEWREALDANGKATLISSPSWAGAYPWIDKTRHLYGFFLTHVDTESPTATADHFSSFYGSPPLAMWVRSVLDLAGMPPIHRAMADIGGTRLYYERAGQGPVVIFLHAHSLDCREWDSQFAALSRHYTVIRYDLRGYGKSDLPKEGEQFTHADDLARLMRTLKIKKASLIGLSLGGLVITDFLALHPEMVTSAVVASGAIHDGPPAKTETPAQRAAREAQDQADKQKAIADVNKQGIDAYKHGWLTALIGICGPHGQEIRPQVWNMLQDWSAWQPTHLEAHLLLNTPVAPIIARKKPAAPVLVIMGRYDSAGSHASSEKLLQVDPHAHRLILPDAGHLSNLETPTAFTHAVSAFLAGLPQ